MRESYTTGELKAIQTASIAIKPATLVVSALWVATIFRTNLRDPPRLRITPISPRISFVAREATVATRASEPTHTRTPERENIDNNPEYCTAAAFAIESRV